MSELPQSIDVWVCPECRTAATHAKGQTGRRCGCVGWTMEGSKCVRAVYVLAEVTDETVEQLTADLLAQQVEIIARFNRPLRDEYVVRLHNHVREALGRAFSTSRSSEEAKAPECESCAQEAEELRVVGPDHRNTANYDGSDVSCPSCDAPWPPAGSRTGA